MQARDPKKSVLSHGGVLTLLAAASLALAGCEGSDGSTGPPGPPGEPATPDKLDPEDDAPGVVVEIIEVTGATGPGGNFQVGDSVTARFTVRKDDGTDWDLAELDYGRGMVSGPTFNYQRVLAEVSDFLTASTTNPDGSHSYTFATPIPATYLPPLNDSPTFGAEHGELAGQPLLSGTYTLGMYFAWSYTVGQDGFRDQGDATIDFLLGNAAAIEPRAVVGQENCNACHVELQAHGGLRRDVTLCLLCHTAGAEDRNNPAAAGGTPDVTIAFEVMIHKIHNGGNLPSVLGVATNPDGSRNYAATPKPYEIVGYGNSVHDFSHVAFPAWPGGMIAMPRDSGYSSLSSAEKSLEDQIRRGVTDCAVCHGDPDGDGPITAPAQGGIAYSQPARQTCGSCHDDIDWSLPYTANGMTMPAQSEDSACKLCHGVSGDGLAVQDAHRHPLLDPSFNPGLNFVIESVEESGTHDGDGTVDPGEKVLVTFRIIDDSGDEVAPSEVSSFDLAISGPTTNFNLVTYTSVPRAALTGAQPFSVHVPERVHLELVGTVGAGTDVFTTARAPHWNVTGAQTEVLAGAVAGGGASSVLTAATVLQNYLDLADASGFQKDDYVVVDRGVPGAEEHLRVQWVDGNRIWFSSPYGSSYPSGPRYAHPVGAIVEVMSCAVVDPADYDLDPDLGIITETGDFGDGNAILVGYTTDFEMPSVFPLALNESPSLTEAHGEWCGKSIVDGTYSLGMWGYRSLTLSKFGETNSYRGSAPGARHDFLVGSATVETPYDLIATDASCTSCHQDVMFHGGGRRGFDACIMCHGTAGSEDRPRYVAPGAPATEGVTVNFRTMLHKIHMGEDLAHASSYAVIGYGLQSLYPNNFSTHTYEEVVFPPMPGAAMHCAKCHGEDNSAWKEPAPRNHPTEQGSPTLSWTVTCGSCHDADAAQAHIEVMTSGSGAESCGTCHGIGDDLNVPLVHKTR